MKKLSSKELEEAYANCIAQAYAYYEVELAGREPVQTASLEEVILAVIDNPPPGRFISTMPALIAKNENLKLNELYKRVKDNDGAQAKLGYILDLACDCAEVVLTAPKRAELRERIKARLTPFLSKLHKAKNPVVWIPEKHQKYFDPEPKEVHEIKWNVRTSFGFERVKDHFISYVKYA